MVDINEKKFTVGCSGKTQKISKDAKLTLGNRLCQSESFINPDHLIMCKEVRGASLLVTHCGEAWYDVVFNSWRTLKRIYASMVRGNYGRKALPTPTPSVSLSLSLTCHKRPLNLNGAV